MFDLNELLELCIVIDIKNKPTPLLFYLACQAVITSLKFHYIWICIDIVYSTVDVELGFLQWNHVTENQFQTDVLGKVPYIYGKKNNLVLPINL